MRAWLGFSGGLFVWAGIAVAFAGLFGLAGGAGGLMVSLACLVAGALVSLIGGTTWLLARLVQIAEQVTGDGGSTRPYLSAPTHPDALADGVPPATAQPEGRRDSQWVADFERRAAALRDARRARKD